MRGERPRIGAMNGSTPHESLLLSQFRAFYAEVVRLKQMILSGTWVYLTGTEEDDVPVPARAAAAVQQRLITLFEQQGDTALHRGEDHGSAVFEEARYVMAVLADEQFLHVEWEGRVFWNANLLESRLFGSHGAGEILFQKLDRLLLTRDPALVDLAKIYLFALALGFEGKFRGTDELRDLDGYRRKLFSFIARREPNLLDSSRNLFPDAYAYTLDDGPGHRLPPLRQWIAALAVVVVVFLGLGHVIWTVQTAELQQVNEAILRK